MSVGQMKAAFRTFIREKNWPVGAYISWLVIISGGYHYVPILQEAHPFPMGFHIEPGLVPASRLNT